MNVHDANNQWRDLLAGFARRTMKTMTTLCLLIAVSMSAYATNLEFYRWQSGEFAATLRYLKHKKTTPEINELYAKEIGGFLKSDDLTIGFLCPEEASGAPPGRQWIFFGARFLPLVGSNGLPSFYAVTYLGGATHFHNGNSYDALITAKDVRSSMGVKNA